ncbi:MAG TPA: hypothetical protein PLK35_01910 [Candidatus Moranbacteria bacterium]|nr:hypothetical protein [Candidatus Moranbacteria bacterium]
MTKKRLEKIIPSLKPEFKDILVCREKEIRPMLEIFAQEPENVFQEGLGTIFGILEITDNSEDSSYVVNYLISVIKKEYFSNTKRGPIESFEAALHKANLALAKLAEHENVAWIGHINAVCAVIEKNNIHLSQTGNAFAFLLRSNVLTNISEEETEDPNPLKTFQEVVSGRLEVQDKLILTTESIFEIFSPEEIKRSAIKFSQAEFIQFLKTALINELERAAVMVIDIKEEEKKEDLEIIPKAQKINAFSQEAFGRKKPTELEKETARKEERKEVVEEIKRELEKTQEGFVDKKTGHIYIKDDGYAPSEYSPAKNYVGDISQKIASSSSSLAASIKNKVSSLSFSGVKRKKAEENIVNENISQNQEAFPGSLSNSRIAIAKKLALGKDKSIILGRKIGRISKLSFFYAKIFIINRIANPLKNISREIFVRIKSRSEKRNVQQSLPSEQREFDYSQNPQSLSATREEKKEWFKTLSPKGQNEEPIYEKYPDMENRPQKQTASSTISGFLPKFSKIKEAISRLDYQKKVYAIIVLILLFIVPYFIAKIAARWEDKSSEAPAEAPVVSVALEKDKNVIRVENVDELINNPDLSDIADINGKIFAVSKTEIISAEDGKNYPIPDDFQSPEIVFKMDDLNLLFLLKNNRILSFSATAKKFQENNISIPENAQIKNAGCYLTYAYLLDSKNNQIYRYPRAEGGFGEKTNWLKKEADISNSKDLTISDNIFLTDGKNIQKFFQGKNQEFILEETATPIIIDKIYTQPESENLYILDKTNARIIKLGTGGDIINQYYSESIKNATDITVDKNNGIIYFSEESGIKTIKE